VSDEEAKAAVKILDKRGSGYIEFDEFVAWWIDARGTTSASTNASEAAKANSTA
jgi:Ca2+-binding EF-hand superfamily protein